MEGRGSRITARPAVGDESVRDLVREWLRVSSDGRNDLADVVVLLSLFRHLDHRVNFVCVVREFDNLQTQGETRFVSGMETRLEHRPRTEAACDMLVRLPTRAVDADRDAEGGTVTEEAEKVRAPEQGAIGQHRDQETAIPCVTIDVREGSCAEWLATGDLEPDCSRGFDMVYELKLFFQAQGTMLSFVAQIAMDALDVAELCELVARRYELFGHTASDDVVVRDGFCLLLCEVDDLVEPSMDQKPTVIWVPCKHNRLVHNFSC